MPDISPTEVLTLIPARGGSKGLPGKNTRPFLGKPLIAHTIDAARDSGVAGRITVSTDDPEIAGVSRTHGAEVPFLRPPEIAADDSPVLAAALHAVDWFIQNESWEPRWILLLQPTSPLRTADDIRHAFDLLRETEADAVVGVSETKSHPYWVKSLTEEGFLRPFVEGQSSPSRRQDLPPAYALNGMLFLVRVSTLREKRAFCPRRSLPLVIPSSRAFDIDTAHDFLIAEYVARLATV
jgi:CMP-N,N'-diacetyllegionaminic acid synthase